MTGLTSKYEKTTLTLSIDLTGQTVQIHFGVLLSLLLVLHILGGELFDSSAVVAGGSQRGSCRGIRHHQRIQSVLSHDNFHLIQRRARSSGCAGIGGADESLRNKERRKRREVSKDQMAEISALHIQERKHYLPR